MSTSGQKRKLEDTDIHPDGDVPLKQQKLTPNQDTPTKGTEASEKEEEKETETKQESEPKDTNNNKPEAKTLDEATFQKLKEQIEYYFSDSNLPLDTHIIETSKMEHNNGFFPLSGLLGFKLVKALTQDLDSLIIVIESSSKLQLNDTKTGVRRHPDCGALPTKDEIHQRTIFAKGFHPRTTWNQLSDFWKSHVDEAHVLSIRNIKDRFQVGIGEDNKPKMVRRFLGNCTVEFTSVDLAETFSKMAFTCHGRTIRCGMYQSYWNDDIEWSITKQYYPFESNKILFIREIPTYSTYSDIKNWIGNALYGRRKKATSVNRVEYVYKELNAGIAYARFGTDSEITNCVQLLKKKALMGMYPKLSVLNDEQASRMWKKLAQKPVDTNKDVKIKVSNQRRKMKEEQENEDEDIDVKDNKETVKKESTIKTKQDAKDRKETVQD
eukprot:161946_1